MSRTNERGNTITDTFFLERSRYHYDGSLGPAWRQYDTDQDAWYFGVWVNTAERTIITFAEGDESVTICPTAESFRAEIESMAEFYGPPPPAFKVIDADGVLTEYYDNRPTAEEG